MNEILPVMHIPVLRTARLARTVAHYRDALGFSVAQLVPGVVALMRHGPVCLQLWQHGDLAAPESCRIALNGVGIDIFQCHARLAASARPWMDMTPRLKPWGAWEFCLLDAEGNRLIFVQWALGEHVLPQEEGDPQGDVLPPTLRNDGDGRGNRQERRAP